MKRVGAAGYGNDLRERIVAAVQRGDTITAVARQYEVTHRTVVTYLKKVEEGTLEQRLTPSGRPRTVQAEHEQQLLKQLETHPDATLVEHASMLEAATGLKISYRTVDRVFRRHHITHKKNAGRQRTESGTANPISE